MMHTHTQQKAFIPRLIALETTRKCPLKCQHCRASACNSAYSDELSTKEIFALLDNVASFAKPIIILTGGEPMTRADIYDIARYGTSLGLRMVMAPCGILMNRENVQEMMAAGIERISLSLDGATAQSHDAFRQSEGSFDSVITAATLAREAGLSFQINTTVTKLNYRELDKILDIALSLGAVSYHPFLLVPTGRGEAMANLTITKEEYEERLNWIYDKSQSLPIDIKPTCAPHYYRIIRERTSAEGRKLSVEHDGMAAKTKGCLGGFGFAFVSHRGSVQICGFLEKSAGNLRKNGFNFRDIWETSPFLQEIRDLNGYHGKCGVCSYKRVCGGCRARSFAQTGDYLHDEPYCLYQPKKGK